MRVTQTQQWRFFESMLSEPGRSDPSRVKLSAGWSLPTILLSALCFLGLFAWQVGWGRIRFVHKSFHRGFLSIRRQSKWGATGWTTERKVIPRLLGFSRRFFSENLLEIIKFEIFPPSPELSRSPNQNGRIRAYWNKQIGVQRGSCLFINFLNDVDFRIRRSCCGVKTVSIQRYQQ